MLAELIRRINADEVGLVVGDGARSAPTAMRRCKTIPLSTASARPSFDDLKPMPSSSSKRSSSAGGTRHRGE